MKLIPPVPPVVDGVSQNPIKEGPYQPKGILSHEYFPLETVMISECGNDLSYMTTYWSVDRIWQLFIKDKGVYERLRDKLLQQRTVVVDYTDMNNLGIYIPKPKYFSGIDQMFRTVIDELRQLDRESLDRHLSEGMKIEDVLSSHYERL